MVWGFINLLSVKYFINVFLVMYFLCTGYVYKIYEKVDTIL